MYRVRNRGILVVEAGGICENEGTRMFYCGLKTWRIWVMEDS